MNGRTPVQIEFRALEISPSPNGEHYEGRFLFANKGSEEVRLSVPVETNDVKLEPNGVGFQLLRDRHWQDVGRHGHGFLVPHPVKPGETRELFVDLSPFDEQEPPLTGRIGLEGGKYWSEPFVLDWKNDRKAGKFEKARSVHILMLRNAFAKAGFRKEELAGDDFPTRFFGKLLKQLSPDDASEALPRFRCHPDELPVFLPNGNVLWRLSSGGTADEGHKHTFIMEFSPDRFSRDRFRDATKTGARATKTGRTIAMKVVIEDQAENLEMPPKTVFFLWITINPAENGMKPSQEEADRAFRRMLDAFDRSLEPATVQPAPAPEPPDTGLIYPASVPLSDAKGKLEQCGRIKVLTISTHGAKDENGSTYLGKKANPGRQGRPLGRLPTNAVRRNGTIVAIGWGWIFHVPFSFESVLQTAGGRWPCHRRTQPPTGGHQHISRRSSGCWIAYEHLVLVMAESAQSSSLQNTPPTRSAAWAG